MRTGPCPTPSPMSASAPWIGPGSRLPGESGPQGDPRTGAGPPPRQLYPQCLYGTVMLACLLAPSPMLQWLPTMHCLPVRYTHNSMPSAHRLAPHALWVTCTRGMPIFPCPLALYTSGYPQSTVPQLTSCWGPAGPHTDVPRIPWVWPTGTSNFPTMLVCPYIGIPVIPCPASTTEYPQSLVLQQPLYMGVLIIGCASSTADSQSTRHCGECPYTNIPITLCSPSTVDYPQCLALLSSPSPSFHDVSTTNYPQCLGLWLCPYTDIPILPCPPHTADYPQCLALSPYPPSVADYPQYLTLLLCPYRAIHAIACPGYPQCLVIWLCLYTDIPIILIPPSTPDYP